MLKLIDFPYRIAKRSWPIGESSLRSSLLHSKAYKVVEDLVDIGSWCLDLKTFDLWWSAGARALHGLSDNDEIQLDQALGFYDAPDRDRIRRAIEKTIVDNSPFDVMATLVTREGKARRVRVTGRKENIGGSRSILGVIQDVSQHYDRELTATWLAEHDPLTAVPNRRAFFKTLEAAIVDYENVVVCLFDLDNLKSVNDTLGHAAGDLAIKKAISIALETFPEGYVGRLGGDEFAILLVDEEYDRVVSKSTRCVSNLDTYWDSPFGKFSTACSVGMAVLAEGGCEKSILAKADLALYQSKKFNRAGVTEYSAKFEEHNSFRKKSIAKFSGAIQSGQVSIAFQPIVEANKHEIIGFEALARIEGRDSGEDQAGWNEAFGDNSVSKAVFGLVLDRAAEFAKAAGVPVHINATYHDLISDPFVDTLIETCGRWGLLHSDLVIEAREDAIVGKRCGRARQVVRNLATDGFGIALDDFGTGLSSLASLDLPLSMIKIDKSIVDGLENGSGCSLMAGLAQIARSRGVAVVAEGVEKEHQAALCKAASCNALQGYLFGLPRNAQYWLDQSNLPKYALV